MLGAGAIFGLAWGIFALRFLQYLYWSERSLLGDIVLLPLLVGLRTSYWLGGRGLLVSPDVFVLGAGACLGFVSVLVVVLIHRNQLLARS